MTDILPLWFMILFSGIFGAVIGSFLNVVIYRCPEGKSLNGRSHCPKCDHLIRGYDNIPVISWLILGAKCRDCKAPISPRYPIVEAFTALSFALVTAWAGGWSLLTVALLAYASVSISLALIDLDTLRLPDNVVFPGTIIVTLLLLGNSLITGDWGLMLRGVAAAAIFLLFYGGIWLLSGGRGLGFGDVKLAPLLGLVTGYYSWNAVIIAVAAAWFLGGVVGGIGLLTHKVGRKSHIPFGPFLIVGSWIGIVWGTTLVDGYLSLFGLK